MTKMSSVKANGGTKYLNCERVELILNVILSNQLLTELYGINCFVGHSDKTNSIVDVFCRQGNLNPSGKSLAEAEFCTAKFLPQGLRFHCPRNTLIFD